jgi:hypothetical protein
MRHKVYDKNISVEKKKELWQQIITDFKHSGLTQKQYAINHGLNRDHLTYYLSVQRKSQPTNNFIAVEISKPKPEHNNFILKIANNMELVVSPNFDKAALLNLLTTLRQLPC